MFWQEENQSIAQIWTMFYAPWSRLYVYEYAGTSFPDAGSYETVCKWCAKSKDFHSDLDSSCTNTSSSSEEER